MNLMAVTVQVVPLSLLHMQLVHWCLFSLGLHPQTPWSTKVMHINVLELKAVHLALQHFWPRLKGYHVPVQTDSLHPSTWGLKLPKTLEGSRAPLTRAAYFFRWGVFQFWWIPSHLQLVISYNCSLISQFLKGAVRCTAQNTRHIVPQWDFGTSETPIWAPWIGRPEIVVSKVSLPPGNNLCKKKKRMGELHALSVH